MLKHILIAFNILLFLQTGFSQTCYDYYKTHCTTPKGKFDYTDTQSSVSYMFVAGQVKQAKLPLVAGKDYRITVCADSVFNQMVNIKLINQEGRIIYDNADYKYSLTLEFMSKSQQTAYIEVTIPDMMNPNGTVPKGCVGIRVQSMLSVRLGF